MSEFENKRPETSASSIRNETDVLLSEGPYTSSTDFEDTKEIH